MLRIYISYQLQSSAALAKQIADHLKMQGFFVYVDLQRIEKRGYFPDLLKHDIAASDVFICLVAESTFQSGLVRREIRHAHSLGKPMIPILQEDYYHLPEKPPPPDRYVAALLAEKYVPFLDRSKVKNEVSLARLGQLLAQAEAQQDTSDSLAGLWRLVSRLVMATVGLAGAALVLVVIFQMVADLRPDFSGGQGPTAVPPTVVPATVGVVPVAPTTTETASPVPPPSLTMPVGPTTTETASSVPPPSLTMPVGPTIAQAPPTGALSATIPAIDGLPSMTEPVPPDSWLAEFVITATALADASGDLPTAPSLTVQAGWRLVFASDRGGVPNLYMVDASCLLDGCTGAAVAPLTAALAGSSSPAWSPDGGRLAFISARDGAPAVWLAGADGSVPTRLTADLPVGQASGDASAWSPDGTRLVYTAIRDNGVPVLSVIGIDGTGLRRLTGLDGGEGGPAWSWTTDRLAFSADRVGDWELYTVDMACLDAPGGCDASIRRLTDHPGLDTSPAWSSDGSRIAFRSARDGNPEIYVMAADGTDLRRVTTHPAADDHPTWSPDGRWLVFQSQRDGDWDLYGVATTCLDVTPTGDACEAVLRRLTDSIGFDDQQPAWEPLISP